MRPPLMTATYQRGVLRLNSVTIGVSHSEKSRVFSDLQELGTLGGYRHYRAVIMCYKLQWHYAISMAQAPQHRRS